MALLGNLTGSSQFFNPDNFYNGVATTSLRLDKASSGYLYRTPSGATNRRTFTIAFWYKTSIVFASEGNDQNNPIFYADEPDGGGLFALNVSSQGQGAASDTVNEMQYYDYDSGDTTDYGLETNSSFSDPSAWYHVVWAFDTTQGTEANRVKVYINGVQRAYTDMNQHHAAVIQNRELNVNQATPHWIGRNIDTTSRYMNGYLADFNFIDGTQYAASDFGEFKNGIWIPKEPNVTYGTNGFRLQFKNTSVGSGSSSTIGADTSGNDNHFTSSGIAANDCAMPDSPENNFCTMTDITFPLAAKGTIAEGGLKLDATDHQVQTSTFSIPASGKWYWEVNFVKGHGGSDHIVQYIGVMSSAIFHAEQDISSFGGGNYVGSYIRHLVGVSYIAGNDIYYSNFTATSTSNGANESGGFSEANGTGILSLALDVDAGTLKYYWNNSLVRTDSTLTANIEYFAHTNLTNSGGNIWQLAYFNFGQDSSFAGTKTAQGNTDGNGNGDFYYAVPSGHLALCSANLPEPTIGPNSDTQADDHFDTLLYTGNGSARDIGGLEFKPDWVWVKGRSYADHHALFDSSRGVLKMLFSNGNFAESTESDSLDEFRSDGFGINGTGADLMNKNTATYVAWNWKANGGSTSSNSDGSITSTVQANTTAGFSISLYTGNATAGATVGHGLGVAPSMVIVKTRSLSSASSWLVFHNEIASDPQTDGLFLDVSDAVSDSALFWNDTAPSSSVVTLGGAYNPVNGNNATYVMYAFANVEGYSKFGSYFGNGNVNGTFVYTGFRPAWVMLKNTARSADWRINDVTRQDRNNVGYSSAHLLAASSTSAEITNEYDIDFLSNGFKLRSSDVYENGSGAAFVYMAFAESPFKYANAG